MDCVAAEPFISILYDGEDVPEEASRHIVGCPGCRVRLREYAVITSEIRALAAAESQGSIAVSPPPELLPGAKQGAAGDPALASAQLIVSRSWSVLRDSRKGWCIAAAVLLGVLAVMAVTRLITRAPAPKPSKPAGASESNRPAHKLRSPALQSSPMEASEVSNQPNAAVSGEAKLISQPLSPKQAEAGFSSAGKMQVNPVSPVVPGSLRSTYPASQPIHSGWALEVRRPMSAIPTYLAVGGAGTFSVRDADSRLDQGPPAQVHWVKIRSSIRGDMISVQVSILDDNSGPTVIEGQNQTTSPPRPGDDQPEKVVGSYLIRPGEPVRVLELQAFNVEPFEIRAVDERPTVHTPFQVVNKTYCMQVVDVEEKTGGRCRLTLKNVSNQTVVGLVYTRRGGLGMMNQDIPPGGRADVLSMFSPTDPKPPQITLNMALFNDGSYEGEVESVAIFDASMKMRPKLHATRMLPLLTHALESWKPEQAETIAEGMQSQIISQPQEADYALVERILRKYPSVTQTEGFMTRLKFYSEMGTLKHAELIEMRRETQRNGKVEAALLWSWLNHKREIYEKLLASPQ